MKPTNDDPTGTSSVTRDTDGGDAREPYEPPRLETEELFEVLALACGKVNPTSFNCQRFPRLS
jgi:hypothetical protein